MKEYIEYNISIGNFISNICSNNSKYFSEYTEVNVKSVEIVYCRA